MTARRLIPSLLLFVAALALGLAVRGPAGPAERALADAVMRSSPSWIADGAESLGSLPVFAALTGIAVVATFAASRRRWSAAFAVGLVVELPVEILKVVIDRPRPPTATEVEAFGSIASYPSGHVARVVVLTGLLVAVLLAERRRGAWIAVPIGGVAVGFVAFGRIAAGVHWPTDVLGGILVGVGWLLGALVIAEPQRRTPRAGRPLNGSSSPSG